MPHASVNHAQQRPQRPSQYRIPVPSGPPVGHQGYGQHPPAPVSRMGGYHEYGMVHEEARFGTSQSVSSIRRTVSEGTYVPQSMQLHHPPEPVPVPVSAPAPEHPRIRYSASYDTAGDGRSDCMPLFARNENPAQPPVYHNRRYPGSGVSPQGSPPAPTNRRLFREVQHPYEYRSATDRPEAYAPTSTHSYGSNASSPRSSPPARGASPATTRDIEMSFNGGLPRSYSMPHPSSSASSSSYSNDVRPFAQFRGGGPPRGGAPPPPPPLNANRPYERPRSRPPPPHCYKYDSREYEREAPPHSHWRAQGYPEQAGSMAASAPPSTRNHYDHSYARDNKMQVEEGQTDGEHYALSRADSFGKSRLLPQSKPPLFRGADQEPHRSMYEESRSPPSPSAIPVEPPRRRMNDPRQSLQEQTKHGAVSNHIERHPQDHTEAEQLEDQSSHSVTPSDDSQQPQDLSTNGTHNPVDGASDNTAAVAAPTTTSLTKIGSIHRDDVSNMGCTCKKSKCLKLYCQCFAASVMCGPNCRCLVCHNTPRNEMARKEAIRSILARNPSAFETKFRAISGEASADCDPVNGALTGVDGTNNAVVTHKLGCKCRKSACLKKYCECYHAAVKCSVSCRCIGCQNMPPGGIVTNPRVTQPVQSFAQDVVTVRNDYRVSSTTSKDGEKGKTGEPLMVDAAQNLTLLKNASPARKEKQRPQYKTGEVQSVPSLPSLVLPESRPSSGRSSRSSMHPGEEELHKIERQKDTIDGIARLPNSSQQSEKNVNALLMVAMAIEMHSSGTPPGTPKKLELENGDKSTFVARESSPARSTSPDRTRYRSPKRKSNSDDEDSTHTENGSCVPNTEASPAKNRAIAFAPISSPQREHVLNAKMPPRSAVLSTPNEQLKKRSRLGSHKKMWIESSQVQAHTSKGSPCGNTSTQSVVIDTTPLSGLYESGNDEGSACSSNNSKDFPEHVCKNTSLKNGVSPSRTPSKALVGKQPLETPTPIGGTPSAGGISALTPVSARCIDFDKMAMADNEAQMVTVPMDMDYEKESKVNEQVASV